MNVMGFDPLSMSDQELLDKTVEVHKRLAWAGRFSNDAMLVDQLKNMADACAFAQGDRNAKRAFEAMNKNIPDCVDIDGPKKIAPKTNGKSDRNSATREGSFRAARTSRPTVVKD